MATHRLAPQQKSLLLPTHISKFMNVFTQENIPMRVVGGAVRDALFNLSIQDWDFATPCEPHRVAAFLQSKNIKTVSRGAGFEHGTVIAIFEGKPLEVTTLRKDVETDGRRARVTFTQSWQEDAQRRDFTINALYADADGNIHDYVHGLEDIQKERVRFIGPASERILEDVLRILRYFRFFARYQKNKIPNDEALEACTQHAPRLAQLSGERIWSELEKLLQTPLGQLTPTLQFMAQSHIFQPIFPHHSIRVDALSHVNDHEYLDPPLKLAALLGFTNLRDIALRLKLSKSLTRRLASLESNHLPQLESIDLKKALYTHGGIRPVADLLFKKQVTEGVSTAHLFSQISTLWDALPTFPVTSGDLAHLSGPELGKALKRLKTLWVESGFTLAKDDLIKK